MASHFSLKDAKADAHLIRGRILLTGGIIAILTIVVIVHRVLYLQVIQYEHFTTLSESNQLKILPVPPKRGLILSRDGRLMAGNKPSFDLELIPEQIENLDETIKQLSQLIGISENDLDRFHKISQGKQRFESIPLKLQVNDKEIARFVVNRHHFPGVDIVSHSYRYYPYGESMVNAVGYVSRINQQELEKLDQSNYRGTDHIGKLGVEKAYEDLLHGQVGYQQVEVNVDGRVIRILEKTESKPGKNLYLTLDISLQLLAIESLQDKRGAIVAIDPNNGDILALVSSPAYEPNAFVNGVSTKYYSTLLESEDAPLINRALQGQYPPGSTVKPFLALAALSTGIREPETRTRCKGWYSLKGSRHQYRDWKKNGHGQVNMHHAIMESCDVYFYSLAHDLGIDRINQELIYFGMGTKAGIDISGEATGLIPSEQWKKSTRNEPWYPGETLIAGIGQGYMLITPLQLAMATTILANRGKRFRPRLVYKTSNPIQGTAELLPVGNPEYVKIYSDAQWDYVINAMQDVVHGSRGTARRSGAGAAYRFAGKTGTAQVFSIAQGKTYNEDEVPERLQDHALFIAFAPVEAPKIALAIVVENGGSGSSSAAPIARKLLDQYLLDGTQNKQ